MSRSARDYLLDLLDYVLKVAAFTSEGYDAFMRDEKTQFAVIRAYEVIGEIAKCLPTELLDTQPEIEWPNIKEFWDFLAHNYERIRLDIVWGAVEKLPILKTAVQAMLSQIESGS